MTSPEDREREVRSLVDRAVTMAVPPGETYERKIRPESEYGITTPRPRAGLDAALLVVRLANAKAYSFARELRGEGAATWTDVADLLGIPWSPDYRRSERAYELVAGPSPSRRGAHANATVYWTCGGPGGCGQYVTDRGPYEGNPCDCEQGHADGCVRHEADVARYLAEQEDRDERERVMAENLPKVTDSFGQETIGRVQYVLSHGGRWLGWSTSESLAVALVLRDKEALEANGYPTQREALARITSGMGRPPANPEAWLRLVRLAATGVR